MTSSCPRGRVKSKGRCLKKCKPGQSRSRTTNRCRETARSRKRTKPHKNRASSRTLRKKSASARRRTTTRRTKTRAKATSRKPTKRATNRKPTKRQLRNSRGVAAMINRLEGRRVVKVSAKGGVRPSAGQAWRDGARVGTEVRYDGKRRRLRLDKNNRPYWGKP